MNNIILVGFMGTGKTTIYKQLATKLGLLLDMDHLIETAEENPSLKFRRPWRSVFPKSRTGPRPAISSNPWKHNLPGRYCP